MAEEKENEADNTLKAKQASAGAPRSMSHATAMAALDDEPEPSPEDLDARQAAMGEKRRGGPPLPGEGGTSGAAAMALPDDDAAREPQTNVKETPRKDN